MWTQTILAIFAIIVVTIIVLMISKRSTSKFQEKAHERYLAIKDDPQKMLSYMDETNGTLVLRSQNYPQHYLPAEWIVSEHSVDVGHSISEGHVTYPLSRVTEVALDENGGYLSLYINGGITTVTPTSVGVIPTLQPNEVLGFHLQDLPIAQAIVERISNYNKPSHPSG